MMTRLIYTCFLMLVSVEALPQRSTLFDDTRISSIFITLPPDSLEILYDSILSDHYYIARFIFDDQVTRDTVDSVGFRLRGNSSRYSKKKSFKVSFNTYVPSRKYQGIKKLNLNGEHNDPALIREKLFYDLWKRAGMVERRTSFVKVFINDAYYGLYTNLEEMDKEWLERHYPADSGNLYKCAYPADLIYRGSDPETYKNLKNSTSTGGRVYDLQTNQEEDDYTRLVSLITVLNQQPTGNFPTNISAILAVDRFLKALALDVATGNWDDYGYNKNNHYLYDNPADGRFEFITYDPDNTFGIDWFGIDWGIRDCKKWVNKNMNLPLAQKLLAVPAFFTRYQQYLDTIARTIIHPNAVFPRIDSLKLLVQQAAEADTFRTLDYGYSIADFNDSYMKGIDDHTPYGLKPFFTTRCTSILNQINLGVAEEYSVRKRYLQLYPNPAANFLSISLPEPPAGESVLEVFDATGNREMLIMNYQYPKLVDIAKLSPGTHLLRISSTGKTYTAKFIKIG